jgi:ABC-type polysaccharide/polyol phosphate export permease
MLRHRSGGWDIEREAVTMLIQSVKEIVHYRDLLLALTSRDIRVKYKQAAMGMMWVFFMPILAITSGILFRLAMAYFKGADPQLADIVAVMVKSVPWLLFAAIVGGASNSLIGNLNLITKIYFPREVVPLSSLLSALFDFAISFTGLIVLLGAITIINGSDTPIVFGPALLWTPLLLAILIIMAAAFGLLLSCANVFFRDVKYIVQVMLQFGIFFSLVYFSYEELGRWGWVLLVNPVAPLLEAMRMAVIDGAIKPELYPWLAYSATVAIGGFFIAIAVFERAEGLFAEYA